MRGEDRPGGRGLFVEEGGRNLIVAKIVRLGGYRERSASRVSVMGRNALDALGQQITGRRMADVTQTDDADHPLALVDYRQPAELQLLHVKHRLCEVIVLPATMDAFGHHIPRHRAASIEVVARKPFADDVAVGHHPYQSVVLPNRNAADVMPPHQFREFGDRGVGADPVDTLVHYVFDFHGGPPYLVSGAFASMQHSPHFLNYTTDRVRRHQRLKVAEEIIIPALLRDRTRQTPSPSPSRTVDSDFATRGSRPTSDAGGLFPNNICPATDTTDIPSVVRAKTPMQCVGRQAGK